MLKLGKRVGRYQFDIAVGGLSYDLLVEIDCYATCGSAQVKGELEVQWAEVNMHGAQTKGAQDREYEENPANDDHDCVEESHESIVSGAAPVTGTE